MGVAEEVKEDLNSVWHYPLMRPLQTAYVLPGKQITEGLAAVRRLGQYSLHALA